MSQVFPINADPRFRIYTAEAAQTAFAVPFPWQDNADITILRTDLDGVTTTLNEAEHYQLTGAGETAGGTMTLNEGEEALEGEEFLILGKASLVRVSSIVQGGRFRYHGTDNDLDRLTIIAQETDRELGRALRTPYGVLGAEVEVGENNVIPRWYNGRLIPGPAWGDGLGVPGPGVPAGGLLDQVLIKNSPTDFDAYWGAVPASGVLTAIDAFAPDVRNSISTAVYVADRAALAAIDTTKDTVAVLLEEGREGIFVFRAGNYATRIAADTLEGIYVKATAISASAGAWVRVVDEDISVKWFGAKGDGTAIDTTPIQAAVSLRVAPVFFPPGKYELDATLLVYNGTILRGQEGSGAAGSSLIPYPELRWSGTGTACIASADPTNLLLHGGIYSLAFSTKAGAQRDWIFDFVGLVGWTCRAIAAQQKDFATGGVFRSRRNSPSDPNWVNALYDFDFSVPVGSTAYVLDVTWTDSQISTGNTDSGKGWIYRGNGNVVTQAVQFNRGTGGLTLSKETSSAMQYPIIGCIFDAIGTGYAITLDASPSPSGNIFAASIQGCAFRNGTTADIRFIDHASDVMSGVIIDGCTFTEAAVPPLSINLAKWSPLLGVNYYANGFKPSVGVVYGNTGGVDNRLLRSDGTGEARLQNSAIAVDDAGNLSGVNSISATGTLNLQNGAAAGLALLGADVNATTITTATRKLARFAAPPYTIGQSPTFIFGADNDGTNNNVFFGGVGTSGALQFATYMAFQTASALNTATGTTWLDIDRNGFVRVIGALGSGVPITKTADFTLAVTENDIINNKAGSGCVMTSAPATFPGRELWVKNLQAQTLTSAASNVVPKTGGAAGTAILPATAGAWARLKSDGTNWIIMASGT